MLTVTVVRLGLNADNIGTYRYHVAANDEVIAYGEVGGHPIEFPWTHLLSLIVRDWEQKTYPAEIRDAEPKGDELPS